jgi:hypothetical protein
MQPTHAGELADEVRAAQTMLRDISDDPKSSEDERTQAEALLQLGPAELATRIEVSQRARGRV